MAADGVGTGADRSLFVIQLLRVKLMKENNNSLRSDVFRPVIASSDAFLAPLRVAT